MPFENIVGKGKDAGNQHFLLSLQCFPLFKKQSLSAVTRFNQTISSFNETLREEPFKNIVGKGENAGNHFLLSSQCCLFFMKPGPSTERHIICQL